MLMIFGMLLSQMQENLDKSPLAKISYKV